jgi:fucose 4-O-acetylase-like acetyltransferase
MRNTSKHYLWVDYAKFLSIFLVVYFHTPPKLSGTMGLLLSLIRMPCFYFLSGILFKMEKYPTFAGFAKHRAQQLLVPYFTFFLLFYIYWLIDGRKSDAGALWYHPVWEYLYGRPLLVCWPMWFLACLYVLQCTFYSFCKLLKQRKWIALVAFAFPFIPVAVDLSNSPWMLENVCYAFPFYATASLFRKEIFTFINEKKKLFPVVSALLLLIIIGYILPVENDCLTVPLQIVGSFSILLPTFCLAGYLSVIFGKIRFVEYVATNAVVVLALHTYVIRVFMLAGVPFLLDWPYFMKLVMSLVNVALLILPIYLINRHLPFMIGKKRNT